MFILNRVNIFPAEIERVFRRSSNVSCAAAHRCTGTFPVAVNAFGSKTRVPKRLAGQFR